MPKLTVIGAGLAGCEAAFQTAERGVEVTLVEMKPARYTPAHHSPSFGQPCQRGGTAQRGAAQGRFLDSCRGRLDARARRLRARG